MIRQFCVKITIELFWQINATFSVLGATTNDPRYGLHAVIFFFLAYSVSLEDVTFILELFATGVILRDSHGVAQVRFVTGNKILRILKAKSLAPDIPEDLYHLIKKAVAIRKHLERNRKVLELVSVFVLNCFLLCHMSGEEGSQLHVLFERT